MRLGLALAQLGTFADPAATRAVAITGEREAFSSLWVSDRLLVPVSPRSRYPGSTDGAVPDHQRRALDPLVTLTLAAAVTTRIRLGTSVLVAPWYPPALLARSLATLDRVSDGRLTVGLGLGWSIDEFEAVGAPMRYRGTRVEEILEVFSTLWRPEPDEIDTSRERIAPSKATVDPVQAPRPPILLATNRTAGLERIARRADGWLPVGLPFERTAAMWANVLALAERYGRDTSRMQLVVRANVEFTDVSLGSDRRPFTGTRRQVTDDVGRAQDIGAAELILDLQACSRSVEELLDNATRLTAGVVATRVA